MVEIREAQEQDDLDVLMLAKKFVRESGSDLPFDRDHLHANIFNMISNPAFVLLTAWKGGDLIGLLAGTKTPTLFSSALIAAELSWYVDPEFRDGTTGLKLVKAFEKWGKDNGCIKVAMSDIEELKDLQDLFSRLGYSVTEKTYTKDL